MSAKLCPVRNDDCVADGCMYWMNSEFVSCCKVTIALSLLDTVAEQLKRLCKIMEGKK